MKPEKLTKQYKKQRVLEIIRSYGGIYPPYEAFYIEHIIYIADRAVSAFERFDNLLKDDVSASDVVGSVQEALSYAAALSRMFWPSKKDDPLSGARGRRLRIAFKIMDDSLLCNRSLRNTFEHFDEKLDEFLLHDRFGMFFPTPRVDDHRISESEFCNVFKLVDPGAQICVLLGQSFGFGPIRREVERVLKNAQIMQEDGGRLPGF